MLAETPAAGADNDLVKDTTTANFRQDVIAESMRQPVLVDFWAPWCGPCKQLTPILEKAVKAAGGKVKLVKMNIDEHPQIAGQLGVQSIPAVFAFQRGQPVDGFMGALPGGQVKGFIERLVGPLGPSAVEDLIAQADELAAEGDVGGAAELYAAVLAQDPENVAALAALVKLHVDLGDLEGAKSFLAMAPAGQGERPRARRRPRRDRAGRAGPRSATSASCSGASTPTRSTTRRASISRSPLNARGKRAEAVDHLLEIVRRDRSWNEDGARKQLVQFFEAWGPTDEMTIAGRRRLSAVLFA